MYNHCLIAVEKKVNKKKVFFLIIIVLTIVALSIYCAIKYVNYTKQKKEEQEKVILEQQELQRQLEIQAEIEKKQQEKEQINTKAFTEEQILTIENIYNADEKRVFLTFDDGPTQSVTPFILDLLKQEDIKATFFVLGNRAKANPKLIKREFEEGHYIANHGYTHKYSEIYKIPENVLNEYNYTEECIQEALENPNYHSKLFRFPGGSNGGYYSEIKFQAKQILKQNGIVYLDWNCLSKDAEGAKTKEQLIQNIIDTMGEKKSLVILMHDSTDKILTYETLPDIIQYLKENGYEFKTIYDIL